jgi:hypothetical protein
MLPLQSLNIFDFKCLNVQVVETEQSNGILHLNSEDHVSIAKELVLEVSPDPWRETLELQHLDTYIKTERKGLHKVFTLLKCSWGGSVLGGP